VIWNKINFESLNIGSQAATAIAVIAALSWSRRGTYLITELMEKKRIEEWRQQLLL